MRDKFIYEYFIRNYFLYLFVKFSNLSQQKEPAEAGSGGGFRACNPALNCRQQECKLETGICHIRKPSPQNKKRISSNSQMKLQE